MKKYLIIELGTNTLKSLRAEYVNGAWQNVIEAIYPTRMGEELAETGLLSEGAIARNLATIENILKEPENITDCEVHIIATESLRKAANADVFIKQIMDSAGYKIRVLTGLEEAELAYHGATGSKIIDNEQFVVIDIGGGSTELILGKGKSILKSQSLPIGAVKLTEFCYHHDPWLEEEIAVISGLVDIYIKDTGKEYPCAKLIGVGGTVTTLAALNCQEPVISQAQLDGVSLSLDAIQKLEQYFSHYTLSDIENMQNMPQGRADIILVGALILEKLMLKLSANEIIVSTKGVRHGYLNSLIEQ